MTSFSDQMGRTISLPQHPARIVSIVPSQTELLYDLGLRDEVAGITKFCIHPAEWFRSKPRVGGTKKLDIQKIRELQPDLIIGNKEENEKEQVLELMKHYPVWMSDVQTLDDALSMISSVGAITGKEAKAGEIVSEIRSELNALSSQLPSRSSSPRTAYFIWKKPYMVAGSNTFIDHMLDVCGFTNVFSEARYPQVTEDDIRKASPSLILLSSEPYPFKEKHVEEFTAMCPGARVMVVDGEMFSWYGSRLLHAPAYFARLAQEIEAHRLS